MNKKKLVFWRKPTNNPIWNAFAGNPEYHAFFAKCNEVFEFRFGEGKEAYLGGGFFNNVSIYKDGKIIPTEGEFKADVIYQFKKVADENFDNAVPIVDTFQFKKWCGDKWSQYQLLKEYMPQTILIEKEEDLYNALGLISTQKAVLKPRSGQKGENVSVFQKTTMPRLDPEILKKRNGYLLQEFSDTSKGINGIVEGVHDLKLITIDDNIFANLRTPEIVGSEVCTFDSPYTEVALNLLPPEVISFHKKVKSKVDEVYPGQVYTIDIGMTDKGPVVFELNPHTAFPYIHFDYAQDFFDALIKHLQSAK